MKNKKVLATFSLTLRNFSKFQGDEFFFSNLAVLFRVPFAPRRVLSISIKARSCEMKNKKVLATFSLTLRNFPKFQGNKFFFEFRSSI